MLQFNLLRLAEIELQREGIRQENKKYASIAIDRAKTIRHWLDIQERNKAISKAKRLVLVR
jgi:hypothetical protein